MKTKLLVGLALGLFTACILLYLNFPTNPRSRVISGAGFDTNKWEAELRSPNLTGRRLVELYATAVAAQMTNAEVSITGQARLSVTLHDGKSQIYYLDNLLKACATQPGSRPEICRTYLQECLDSETGSNTISASEREAHVIPVIVDDEFMAHFPEVAPNAKPLAAERFVGDLWVAYVIDEPNRMTYLTLEMQTNMGLGSSKLREVAISNLQNLLPVPKCESVTPLFLISQDGNYEASFLLLDSLWAAQASKVNGEIVAAVPARHALLFTDSASPQAVSLLRREARKLHDQEPHPISKTLLIRKSGHWEPYPN